jgi:glycine betaine/choline ABC-type transport system substrate-binding protein
VVLAAVLLLAGCSERHRSDEVVVGAGMDRESAVLGAVYAAALRYYGADARVVQAPDPVTELDTGKVDVVPGFTGRLLQRFAPGSAANPSKDVYRAMVAALPEGVAAGDYAMAAEDTPTAVVTDATALAWGGRDSAALVRRCAQVVAGTTAGTKPPGTIDTCKLPPPREYPTDTALFDALQSGQVNVAWTTAADPGIPRDATVLAEADPPMIQAENVVPLYRRNGLSEQQILAINQVAGELDTAALADMRRQVAQGRDPRQVADSWLALHPLGR